MEKQIELRSLGKSELMITPIGLGCWQFSQGGNWGGKFWPVLNDDEIREIARISLEGGINWFDTAEMYGLGNSEKNLAKALSGLNIAPGQVTVATKWWPLLRTASHIGKSIEERISCLAPFPIDLYQVHQSWGFSSVENEMIAMANLVKAGKIKYVGVSNYSAKQMRRAWETLQKEGISLVSNQVRYSLLDRGIETNGVLNTAKELGITIVAYSPLAQGLVTGKFHENPELIKNTGYRRHFAQFKPKGLEKSRPVIELIRELAGKYGVTSSQIALNWLVNFHGETVVAIPGATKVRHAEENTGAMKFRMTEEDMERIDKVSKEYCFSK